MARSKTALLLVGSLVAATLVAGAAAAPSAQEQPTADTADEGPTITVTGTGETTAEPDRATVHLAVSETGAAPAEAADGVAANASRLRTALESSDPVADVQSTDYSLRERRADRPPEPPQGDESEGERTFLARQTFEVTVEDPGDAGAVIDLALANGASDVGGVAFTLSEERHREVRAEAIDRAVTDAEDRATAIANSTELSLGDVRSIEDRGQGLQPVHTEAADDAAAGTEIDARDVTVDASVEIVYDASTTE